MLDLPLLVGVSRKSMIFKTIGGNADTALNGTTALNAIALMKGANILRVHDVKEAVETVTLFNQTTSQQRHKHLPPLPERHIFLAFGHFF